MRELPASYLARDWRCGGVSGLIFSPVLGETDHTGGRNLSLMLSRSSS
jgi:hypothetical protein